MDHRINQKMTRNIQGIRSLVTFVFLLLISSSVSGCWFINFFNKDGNSSSASHTFSGTVAGQPLGTRAGALNEAALADVYAVTTEFAPAAIRPDPDTYVRQMLKQYREPGATVAREIGSVESYRLLLGGASQDFTKVPQETYDATSLLTTFAVAQKYCIGLVSPNEWSQGDWKTILPYPAAKETENVTWLAQRFLGKKTSEISTDKILALMDILNAERGHTEYSSGDYDIYIPVCSALALDAEALYL